VQGKREDEEGIRKRELKMEIIETTSAQFSFQETPPPKLRKLVLKLRWIGRDDEAECIMRIARAIAPTTAPTEWLLDHVNETD
jgi:hypothetical protein